MTYNDLCDEVTALGFETTIDSPERLFSAAKRALRTMLTEYPRFKTVTLYCLPLTPSASFKEIIHSGGEERLIRFSSSRALSFKSSGKGAVIINDERGERTVSFSGTLETSRQFLYGDGEITLVGEYSYAVLDLAFWKEITDDSVDSIPLLNTPREFDVKPLTDGFISFSGPPVDGDGREIEGARLEGTVLILPHSFKGSVSVSCKCGTDLSEAGEIDIPSCCEHLLALLTASYYWLDDDSDKAQYYASLYREGMSALRYYTRARLDSDYKIGNGWA